MQEIYVSTDVETDGPIPGPHSLLSLGSAAYVVGKTLLGTFSVNLDTLPEARGHPETMEWWRKHPAEYAATRRGQVTPEKAMKDYVAWLEALPGRPVFVAYPATFDFLFVYWYLIRFAGRSPFSFAALDMKSYAMAMLRTEFGKVSKRTMPRHWFDPLPHTHVALDDAIEQGALFCNMLHENLGSGEA
ncbi:MAG: 3'-5' exoribonuclease [Candidatus Riflebacteria bacterium]|nr:3'-5' exoribonuclease [Candidatus Riflebacteria bacterium]